MQTETTAFKPIAEANDFQPAAEPPLDPAAEEQALVERPEPVGRLTVADGFRFGCGLILATVGFGFALVILVALVFISALAFGLSLPLGL